MTNSIFNAIIMVTRKQNNIEPKQSYHIARFLGFTLLLALSIGVYPQPLAAASFAPVEHAEGVGKLDGLLRDEALCGANAYRIEETELCTHGPEDRHAGPIEASGSSAQANSDVDSVVCEGDGVSGQRVQVLYVRAEDQPDRYAENLAMIRQVALEADLIFDRSAHQTGDHRRVRYVTDADCQVDVQHIVLGTEADDTFAATVIALRAQGFNATNRKYLLFVEANVYCGLASSVDDDRPGAENRSNLITGYARIDRFCWSGYAAAHELAHTMGAVQHSAPNATGGWHCTDDNDLLCYSDAPHYPQIRLVCGDPRYLYLFDCNHDDYFHTNPPAGSYLAEHWNLADSAFLINTPEDHAALPFLSFSLPTVRSQIIADSEVVMNVSLLNATTQHPESVIQQVEFFQDGISLGVSNEAPYEFTWKATGSGRPTLTARVTDRHGFSQTLEPITLQIATLGLNTEQLERGSTWVTLLPLVSK